MISSLRSGQWPRELRRWLIVSICLGTLLLSIWAGMTPSFLLLVALVAMLGAVILIREPDLGLTVLVLTAFLVPLEIDVSAAVSANAVMAMVPALALFWLLQSARSGAIHILRSRTFLPLLLLVVVALLALLYGNVQWDPLVPRSSNLLFVQLGQWAMYALSALAFFLAAHQSVRALKWATFAYIGLGVLVLIRRYGGPAGLLVRDLIPPNAEGHSIVLTMLVALGGAQGLFNQQLSKRWRAALTALAFVTLILIFWRDRGLVQAWLPLCVVLFVLLSFHSRRLALMLLVVLILLGILFLPFVLGLYDWEAEWQVAGEGRLLLWRSVLSLAVRQPIFGLGLTTYHHYHRFIPLPLPSGAIYLQPSVNSHNVYIDLFAQMGIIGLAVFLWAIVEIALLGRSLKDRFSDDFQAAYVRGMLAALAGILFASALADLFIPFVYNVGFRGFRFSVFSWLFLGGLVALEQVAALGKGHSEPSADGTISA
jgi:hypothetical protein